MGKDKEDLYKILGVSQDAEIKEIKKAYRKLSKEHHPDKGGDEETFKKISQAYAVLSDDIKRQKYDAGEEYENLRTVKDEAISLLVPLFTTAVMNTSSLFGFNPDTSDVFEKMSGRIRGEVGKIQRDIENIELDIENLNAVRDRIVKGDIFLNACTNLIRNANTQIKRLQHELEVREEATNILETCEYRFDADEYLLELGAE